MDLVEYLAGDEGRLTLLQIAPNDLHSLCQVSRVSQHITTPHLYRRVNLVFLIIRAGGMSRGQVDNYRDCYRRQRLFCETIHQRPELAKFVRELSWTLSFPELSPALSVRWQNYIEPFGNATPSAVWQTFSLLEEIHTLDLRVHPDYFPPPGTPHPFTLTPATLFPNAQAIKLSGTFRPEFNARSILCHNTSRIKCLDIDHMKFLQFASARYKTGTYIGWSKLVQDALPSLKSLTFRKTGASSPEEPFDAAEERKAFAELVMVLEAARESIEYIGLVTTHSNYGCVFFPIVLGAVPVSQGHFQELLLPTLVTGCWPKLKCIGLSGFSIPPSLRDKVGRGPDGKPCVVSNGVD